MHTQLVFAESWSCGADFVGQQGCEGDCAIGDPAQKPTGFMRRNTTPRRAKPNFIVAFLCIFNHDYNTRNSGNASFLSCGTMWRASRAAQNPLVDLARR